MATKKEIKELLKRINFTEAEMDKFWDDLKDSNFIVKNLTARGKTWRDLNTSAIADLPTRKQKDIAASEKKAQEEAEKSAAEEKAKQKREYYNDHFEEVMLSKIDSGEKLTEQELKRLTWDYETEQDEGENRRWSRAVSSIIVLCGRYFCLEWEKGLTECQENEYDDQPYEVEKHTYEKTITVTEWNRAQKQC